MIFTFKKNVNVRCNGSLCQCVLKRTFAHGHVKATEVSCCPVVDLTLSVESAISVVSCTTPGHTPIGQTVQVCPVPSTLWVSEDKRWLWLAVTRRQQSYTTWPYDEDYLTATFIKNPYSPFTLIKVLKRKIKAFSSLLISYSHLPDVSYRLAIVLLWVKHGLKHRSILCLILFVIIITLFHIFIYCVHHHVRRLLIVLN